MNTTPNRPDVGEALNGRWYIVSRHGIVTLCASEQDARDAAAEADRDWPHHAPHIPTRLSPPAPAGDAVLVPREPTDEMIFAGMDAHREAVHAMKKLRQARSPITETYRAMLAAAPVPAVGREAETVTEYDVDSRSYSEYPVCTCPSGDGSLRWPCPQHPPAEAREPVDPLVEEGLAYFEKSGDAGDKMYVAAIRRALTQPRDTQRDSGDAASRLTLEAALIEAYKQGAHDFAGQGWDTVDRDELADCAADYAADAAMQSPTGEPT